MNRSHPMRPRLLLALTAWVLLGAAPAHPSEPGPGAAPLNYAACAPARFKATVMEVDREKGRLLVAEKWVYALNPGQDGLGLKTALSNAEDKPEAFEKFKIGDRVAIIGYEHPDGYVVAAKIRKTKTTAEQMEKKMSQKPRRPNRD
jgi:hypothetical protein